MLSSLWCVEAQDTAQADQPSWLLYPCLVWFAAGAPHQEGPCPAAAQRRPHQPRGHRNTGQLCQAGGNPHEGCACPGLSQHATAAWAGLLPAALARLRPCMREWLSTVSTGSLVWGQSRRSKRPGGARPVRQFVLHGVVPCWHAAGSSSYALARPESASDACSRGRQLKGATGGAQGCQRHLHRRTGLAAQEAGRAPGDCGEVGARLPCCIAAGRFLALPCRACRAACSSWLAACAQGVQLPCVPAARVQRHQHPGG